MAFEVGQTVVYPHHGAATIEKITIRKLKGKDTEYLTLRVTQGDLVIQVPASNVEMVGLRDVVDEDGLAEVKRVLQEPYVEEPTNWSRRYKANDEKIATGDVLKVSEVVRDLSYRDTGRGLSAGEKRMLAKARSILISELALAKEEEEELAEERLDAILAESVPVIKTNDDKTGSEDNAAHSDVDTAKDGVDDAEQDNKA
ncbi:MAG: CarD family transcriptional regulator [Actinomycetaceae bacterium]|nr:CarD family transcriptional regulator [Actinomycetaceae bacterium]